MTLEKLALALAIPARNIRFYDRQGLLTDKKTRPSPREYGEEDVARLKKVWVFRKIGFSIETLSKLTFDGIPLSRAFADTLKRFEDDEIEEVDAMALLKRLSEALPDTAHDYATLDATPYWDEIHAAEAAGGRFFNLENDHLYLELAALHALTDRVFTRDFKKNRRKHGLFLALLYSLSILLLVCLAKGGLEVWLDNGSFWEGFTDPLLPAALVLAVITPVLLVGRVSPKAAGYLMRVILFLCFAFVLALVALVLWSVFVHT